MKNIDTSSQIIIIAVVSIVCFNLFVLIPIDCYAFYKNKRKEAQQASLEFGPAHITNSYKPSCINNDECSFYATLDKYDKLLGSEFNKLCFVEECTIQSNISLNKSNKQTIYFEIEILNLDNRVPLIISITSSCEGIEFLGSKYFIIMKCLNPC